MGVRRLHSDRFRGQAGLGRDKLREIDAKELFLVRRQLPNEGLVDID
jgi:hypothetical protein